MPFENNTSRMVRHITRRNLQAAKMKTLLTLLAIALSVGLLTGLILSELGVRTAEKRSFETRQHVIYHNLTEQQAEALSADDRVADRMIYKQGAYTMEVDDYLLALSYSQLDTKEIETVEIVEGAYPQGLYEVAVDRAYLRKLGLPVELGQEIPITWLDGTQETFTVTGLTETEGADTSGVYALYVSLEYARNGSQLKDQAWNVAIRLQNADDMDTETFREEIRTLGADYGVERQYVNELGAFVDNKTLSQQELILFISVGIAILFISVLVIYNIFYISVVSRVQQFGQMRTLGATKKQIRRMVRREGKILCCLGAPVGIILGGLVAFFIQPKGWSWINAAVVAVIVWLADYITVLLSVRTPAKMASAVSPIEALRTVGNNIQIGSQKARRSHRLTPFRLAIMGFGRSKKATIITIMSLGISGILFMVGFTVINSATAESYSRQGAMYFGEAYIDFSSNAWEQNPNGLTGLQMENPMNEALQERLLAIDGVESIDVISNIYMTFTYRDINSSESVRLMDREDWDRMMKYAQGDPVSYDDAVKNRIVITVDDGVAEEIYGWKFEAGDTIEMRWFDGNKDVTETFKISTLDKAIDRDESAYDLIAETNFFVIPEDLARSMMPENFDFTSALIVKTDYEHLGFEPARAVANLVAEYPALYCTTLEESIQRDQSVFDVLYMVVLGLCLFVVGFSLMNLFNTMFTSILARKKEFTMLRSIGMSARQLNASIQYEGLLYSAYNILIAGVVGVPVGWLLVRLLKNTGAFYFQWSFPGWYLLAYAVLTALIPLIISRLAVRSIRGDTLAEQLRDIA